MTNGRKDARRKCIGDMLRNKRKAGDLLQDRPPLGKKDEKYIEPFGEWL